MRTENADRNNWNLSPELEQQVSECLREKFGFDLGEFERQLRAAHLPDRLVVPMFFIGRIYENQRLVQALAHESAMADKLGLTECASILDTLAVRFTITEADVQEAEGRP